MIICRFTSLLIILLLTSPVLAAETVTLATGPYEPFVVMDGKCRGSFVDIITAAFDEVDIKAEFKEYPWPRCEMLVENGTVFGAFPYGNSPQRGSYSWFADEIWTDKSVFFYLKDRFDNFDFNTLDNLLELTIGGTAGNLYLYDFEKAGLKVDVASQEISGLKKLLKGRVDLFAEEETVGWSLIAKHFPQQMDMFRSTPTPWRRLPLSIIVSQRYPHSRQLMIKFNKGLEIIKQNGTYDAIISRYHINAGKR